jgi:hypothetical protein
MAMISVLGVTMTYSLTHAQTQNVNVTTSTNRSPVILEGIYGRSRTTTNRNWGAYSRFEQGVLNGLRALKQTQNEDGSWGIVGRKGLSTPLVLTALLGHGERADSREFGAAISSAQRWVLASTPTGMAERVASAVALSVYMHVHLEHGRPDLAQPYLDKVTVFLRDLGLPPESLWAKYLMVYRKAPGISRLDAAVRSRDIIKLWKDLAVDLEPDTFDGYLALWVATSSRFHCGGKVAWEEYNRTFAIKMVERQKSDGLYPCVDEADKYACTALAIESRQLYYQFRTW